MTSAQLRAARALLNWTVRRLAEEAHVHRNTITNFETGKYHLDEFNYKMILTVLEGAGIEFIPQNGGGVRLRNAIGE